jgi:hypothetical protein
VPTVNPLGAGAGVVVVVVLVVVVVGVGVVVVVVVVVVVGGGVGVVVVVVVVVVGVGSVVGVVEASVTFTRLPPGEDENQVPIAFPVESSAMASTYARLGCHGEAAVAAEMSL